MNLKISANCEVLLMCEGGDDSAFLAALARHLRIGAAHSIPIDGKPNFRGDVKAVSRDPHFPNLRAFGIVLDADDSAERTLAKINGALRDFFGAGENFLKHGEVKPIESGDFAGISAGAFVIPDGESSGELEDLLLEAASPEMVKCIADFRVCTRPDAGGVEKKKSKQSVQTLISGLPEYCEDLNVALKKGHIDLDSAAFEGLRDFLRKLAAA